jgi:hypothetical protein
LKGRQLGTTKLDDNGGASRWGGDASASATGEQLQRPGIDRVEGGADRRGGISSQCQCSMRQALGDGMEWMRLALPATRPWGW